MAGSDIKARIVLEGVEEYRNSISSANDSLSLLKNQLKLLDTTMKGSEKSIAALTEKKALLGKQAEAVKAKIDGQAVVLEKVKAKYGDSSKEAKKAESILVSYKTQLANVENNLKEVNSALEQLENQVEETSEAVDKGKSKLAGFGDMAKKAGGTLANVGKAGFKAVITGVKAVAATAIGAGTALTAMTISAGKLADDLLTQSAVTRISTDDLQKFKYTLNFIDGDINTLTGSITKNQQNMQKSIEGNKDLRRTYRNLGISIKDSKGQMRDSNEVFWETIDALGKIENPTKREALAMKLLGKSAKELNPIIEAGSEAFKNFGLEAEAMGLIIGQDSLGKLGEFDDTMNKLKLTGEGIKNTFAIMSLPFLQEIADGGLEILGEFNKAMRESDGDATKMQSAFDKLIDDVTDGLTKKLPDFFNMGGKILGSIIEGLGQNSDEIFKGVGTLIGNIKDQLITQGGEILKSAAAGIISGLIGADYESVKAEIEKIEKAIKDGLDNAKASAKAIWDGLTGILTAPFDAMKSAIEGAIEALQKLTGIKPGSTSNTDGKFSGGFWGNYGSTAGWAEGGVLTKPTFFPAANAVVGEAGAEAVIPIRKLFDWMDERYHGREKAGNTVYVTQNIYAESTDYYQQQKQATRQLEALLGNL